MSDLGPLFESVPSQGSSQNSVHESPKSGVTSSTANESEQTEYDKPSGAQYSDLLLRTSARSVLNAQSVRKERLPLSIKEMSTQLPFEIAS
jgi:hypothetical protein